MPFAGDYRLLVAVPDVMVSTPEVYKLWDELGSPRGEERSADALPPALQHLGPFRNDLEPAALSLSPSLAGYRERLELHFGSTFFFSGSGPTMFAFLPPDAQVVTSPQVAAELELRNLFVTDPIQHGASLMDR